MKTTAKEFQKKTEFKHDLQRLIRIGEDLIRDGLNSLETEKTLIYNDDKLKELKTDYFEKLDTVFVEYWIGSRQYASEVVKIGKTYFHLGGKMTKTRGFNSIIEVNKITEQMKKEMLSDSYYY